MTTTVNASLISHKFDIVELPPHLGEQLLNRAHGCSSEQAGSCGCVACLWITASGASPRSRAVVDSRIITNAAAPSEIELELAAVTVPSLPKAALRV
ncbi:hypothetical protein HDG37_002918 [Paraburkholderia sp. MM5384-R2]|nr:hypothetical protein [Paraburkholderia sp. MM5384-R2]